MLEPRAANCSCAFAAAPWPIPITAMTAPTPMIMPSMVRLERILLRPSARRASRNAAENSIAGTSILDCGHGLQYLARDLRNRDDLVSPDLAVAKYNFTLGKLSDIRLMRHKNNRQSIRIQSLEQLHHFDGSPAVQVSRGFVSQQQQRFVRECSRDCDSLLLASRKLRGKMFRPIGQADQRQRLSCAALAVLLADARIEHR